MHTLFQRPVAPNDLRWRLVAIFRLLPGAPDPWSGAVCAVTTDRLHPLAMNVRDVSTMMKRLGKGSSPALREPLARE